MHDPVARHSFRTSFRVGMSALFLLLFTMPVSLAQKIDVGKSFDVKCDDGKKIGAITLNAFADASDAANLSASIQATFKQAADACKLMDGFSYKWIQIYKDANEQTNIYPGAKRQDGTTTWLDSGKWWIDRSRVAPDYFTADKQPFYKFYRNLGDGGVGADELRFSDSPSNGRAGKDETAHLYFATALVCTQYQFDDKGAPKPGQKTFLIDSFTWGYGYVKKDGKLQVKLDDVMHADVRDDIIDAYGRDEDPAFKNWTLAKGCCCQAPVVPESSTMLSFFVLGGLGAGSLAGFTRRRRTPERDRLAA